MFEEYGEMMELAPTTGKNYLDMTPEQILIETVKASVLDWLEKYHPNHPNSNLRVENPENKDELYRWKEGVIGRIKHQILDAGFGNLSNEDLSKIIAIALHEYFIDDPWYIPYLLDILPSAK